jgi:hypothetical protein
MLSIGFAISQEMVRVIIGSRTNTTPSPRLFHITTDFEPFVMKGTTQLTFVRITRMQITQPGFLAYGEMDQTDIVDRSFTTIFTILLLCDTHFIIGLILFGFIHGRTHIIVTTPIQFHGSIGIKYLKIIWHQTLKCHGCVFSYFYKIGK